MKKPKPNRVRHAGGQRFPTPDEAKRMITLAKEGIPLPLCAEACGYLRTELEAWLTRAVKFGYPRAEKEGDFDILDFAHELLAARAEHQIELVRRDRAAVDAEGRPASQLMRDTERWLRFVDPQVWRSLGGAVESTGEHASGGGELSDEALLGRAEAAIPLLRAKIAAKEKND